MSASALTSTSLLLDLIKCNYFISEPEAEEGSSYIIIKATPATGVLYITENSPDFVSGQIRLRGRNNGRYPYRYLEMIERIFGPEENTIEVLPL